MHFSNHPYFDISRTPMHTIIIKSLGRIHWILLTEVFFNSLFIIQWKTTALICFGKFSLLLIYLSWDTFSWLLALLFTFSVWFLTSKFSNFMHFNSYHVYINVQGTYHWLAAIVKFKQNTCSCKTGLQKDIALLPTWQQGR